MNGDPIVPVELLVLQPGLPPRPVSTSVLVPVAQAHRLQAGATLAVKISRSRSVGPGRRLARAGLTDPPGACAHRLNW